MKLEEMETNAKRKANNKCVICHKEVELCYAIDDEKGITEDNIVPLCHLCAQKYLGNADIAKQIKQMRNYWYEQVERAIKQTGNVNILLTNEINEDDRLNRNRVAIYHVVYENEGLEESAKTIYNLIYSCQENNKGCERILYLDIDGHTDEYGRFDNEMLELQQNFIIETLLPYLYEIHLPIISIRNTELQKNNLPKEMHFISSKNEFESYISNEIKAGGYIIEKIQKKYYEENRKFLYKKCKFYM